MPVSPAAHAPFRHPRLPALIAGILSAAALASAQSADSLPAFKPDSAVQEPFRKVEAGPSPWSSPRPDSAARPTSRADSLAQKDSVTAKLRRRRPAIAVHVGIDFIDLDAKGMLERALADRLEESKQQGDSMQVIQAYDPVHLAFPFGIQIIFPVAAYLDVVAKSHSYWYKQNAILGDSAKRHVGDEWFALQANLGGVGLRYYVPPSLLSVTGGLGLYAQGVLFWNLGNTELYTPYGSAPARFDPVGSAYELQFGIQQALSGSWQLSGALGFLHQDFRSDSRWSDIMIFNAPAGKAHWGSSSIQASLNLWYYFGPGGGANAAGAAVKPAQAQPTSQPAAQPDSLRRE